MLHSQLFYQKTNWLTPEAYSESCQTRKMELFAKLVNGWKLLTIFAKSSNLGVWQDSEDAFEFIFDIVSNIFRNIRTLKNDLILTLTLNNLSLERSKLKLAEASTFFNEENMKVIRNIFKEEFENQEKNIGNLISANFNYGGN